MTKKEEKRMQEIFKSWIGYKRKAMDELTSNIMRDMNVASTLPGFDVKSLQNIDSIMQEAINKMRDAREWMNTLKTQQENDVRKAADEKPVKVGGGHSYTKWVYRGWQLTYHPYIAGWSSDAAHWEAYPMYEDYKIRTELKYGYTSKKKIVAEIDRIIEKQNANQPFRAN